MLCMAARKTILLYSNMPRQNWHKTAKNNFALYSQTRLSYIALTSRVGIVAAIAPQIRCAISY